MCRHICWGCALTRIVTPTGIFDAITHEDEKSFERAVVENAKFIFGEGRYYLDCKRRIGAKGKKFNIPDGYLIDLRRNEARLFVVENELAVHDLFKHIGVQLLEFSYSYRQARRQVKEVLFEEISSEPAIREACESYATKKGYRNLDNLLDYLIFETPFQAIVIIDEATDQLHTVRKQFAFPVEVIEFVTYRDANGHQAFSFAPFLQDVGESVSAPSTAVTDVSEIDTIVVPAWEDGFRETFIGENRWYAIRISSSIIPQIKHIAVYRVAPISAITHVAPVNRVVPWENTGKYCVEFAEPAREIGTIKLDQGAQGKAPQAPRYTSLSKLMQARTLGDLW